MEFDFETYNKLSKEEQDEMLYQWEINNLKTGKTLDFKFDDPLMDIDPFADPRGMDDRGGGAIIMDVWERDTESDLLVYVSNKYIMGKLYMDDSLDWLTAAKVVTFLAHRLRKKMEQVTTSLRNGEPVLYYLAPTPPKFEVTSTGFEATYTQVDAMEGLHLWERPGSYIFESRLARKATNDPAEIADILDAFVLKYYILSHDTVLSLKSWYYRANGLFSDADGGNIHKMSVPPCGEREE